VRTAIGAFGDGVLLVGIGLACVTGLRGVLLTPGQPVRRPPRPQRAVLEVSPIPDRDTVLSKLVWALLLAPLMAVGVGIVLGLVLWAVSALTFTVNGISASTAVFTHSHPLRVIGSVLFSLPVYAVGAADRRLADVLLGVGPLQAFPVGGAVADPELRDRQHDGHPAGHRDALRQALVRGGLPRPAQRGPARGCR
jgi:hypothetical protein